MGAKILFIVGAGASKEAGLPTGEELKEDIRQALNIRFDAGWQIHGDQAIYAAMRQWADTQANSHDVLQRLLHVARRVSEGMPQALSIDNYIDSHRADPAVALVGKLAIARCILEHEKRSFLHTVGGSGFPLAKVHKSWYGSLAKRITERCTFEELSERLRSIKMVVFNYDRCIEHSLPYLLGSYYAVPVEEVQQMVRNDLQIYHPYGMVGSLPWMGGRTSVHFGASPGGQHLMNVSEELKTFTEGVDPTSSEIATIWQEVAEARKVAFLGFGFHNLNMELLFGGDRSESASAVIGTSMGLSIDDQNSIAEELADALEVEKMDVRLHEGTCTELFQEFSRKLTLC